MFVREAVPEKEKGRVRHHGSWTEESRRGLLGVTTQLCLSLYLSENIIFKLYLNYFIFITVLIKIKKQYRGVGDFSFCTTTALTCNILLDTKVIYIYKLYLYLYIHIYNYKKVLSICEESFLFPIGNLF